MIKTFLLHSIAEKSLDVVFTHITNNFKQCSKLEEHLEFINYLNTIAINDRAKRSYNQYIAIVDAYKVYGFIEMSEGKFPLDVEDLEYFRQLVIKYNR